jgi:hypothetical protein
MYSLLALGMLNLAATVLLHPRSVWPVACLDLLLALFMALEFANSWIALATLVIVVSLYCGAVFVCHVVRRGGEVSS